MRRATLRRTFPFLLAVLVLFAAHPVPAVLVPLDYEFDTGARGDFGQVEVTQNDAALDFSIALGPDLNALGGGAPDMHRFYFNLIRSVTGLSILADDAPTTPYSVRATNRTSGGAGAKFEFEVSLGNGAGRKGNGVLNSASFTLGADQPLALFDLSETRNPNSVDPSVQAFNFALHVQGTAAFPGASSETVGGGTPTGVIPEPHTFLLTSAGLLGLAVFGRRRR